MSTHFVDFVRAYCPLEGDPQDMAILGAQEIQVTSRGGVNNTLRDQGIVLVAFPDAEGHPRDIVLGLCGVLGFLGAANDLSIRQQLQAELSRSNGHGGV